MVQKKTVFTGQESSADREAGLPGHDDNELTLEGNFENYDFIKPEVPVVQLGIGTVGMELIKKVSSWNRSSSSRPKYRHVGLADKSGLVSRKAGFSEEELDTIKQNKVEGRELSDLYPGDIGNIGFLESFLGEMDRGVLVDVTDAKEFEDLYRIALDRGWSVVLANKIPLTKIEPGEFVRLKKSGLRYETTVGAGLPVISTLDHLRRHGEKFKEIAAILSGSLSYILSQLELGVGLKRAVIEAKQKGFTEPNPAEDLLGKDVARKTVILGRSLGLGFSIDDIELEPLIPLDETRPSMDKLTEVLEDAASDFRKKMDSAREHENRLRYVARINGKGASVGLEEVSKDGPLGQGISTANVVLFRTRNYDNPPLVVQGPGAGPAVTAGGIFSDIKRCRARCRC